LKITARQYNGIRWNPITFRQDDYVPSDDLAPRNALCASSSDYQGARARQIPQCFKYSLGPMFLNDRNDDSYDRRTNQNEPFAEVTQHEVNRARGQQQLEHWFPTHFNCDAEKVALSNPREFVVSFGPQPSSRLVFRQAVK
jgi:hypothetical protein